MDREAQNNYKKMLNSAILALNKNIGSEKIVYTKRTHNKLSTQQIFHIRYGKNTPEELKELYNVNRSYVHRLRKYYTIRKDALK